jgi:hypothetical protein
MMCFSEYWISSKALQMLRKDVENSDQHRQLAWGAWHAWIEPSKKVRNARMPVNLLDALHVLPSDCKVA